MLRKVSLNSVGPAGNLSVDFSSRINYLTGDNGLGKSFILDVAWWSLTRSWARGVAAYPRQDSIDSVIQAEFDASTDLFKRVGTYVDGEWSISKGRPPIPGIVIYAGVDGGFSVWDPVRNYWRDTLADEKLLDDRSVGSQQVTQPKLFDFTSDQIWYGLEGERKDAPLCNGLIYDWVVWQIENSAEFNDLVEVLYGISPGGNEILKPGMPKRINGGGTRRHPIIKMAHGEDVPLIHASAGIKRVAALAYLLVWAWHEHKNNALKKKMQPAREIILLIDEIECHLHPKWQRKIIPSLLKVIEGLTKNSELKIQIIAATHSPLVLASTEYIFDSNTDSIVDFDLVGNKVIARKITQTRYGDVNSWLESDVFDLSAAMSFEAESAISEALEFLRETRPVGSHSERIILTEAQKKRFLEIDANLWKSIKHDDTLMLRWHVFKKRLGDLS